jgi:AcrR family transcriptional regulator
MGANKRERTRALMLDTAVDVFAGKGISNGKIHEITQLAGLANGTFYNHFKDKNELVAETAVAIATEIGKRLDEAMSDIEDALERVVVASSRFIGLAVENRNWGTVLVDSFNLLPSLRADAVRYLRADIKRGIDQGHFDVTLDPFLLDQIGALMISALRAQTGASLNKRLVDRTSEHILRLLGLTPSKAHRAVIRSQTRLEALAV